jgi:predicted  nucleic acid-binding Zn-ribbon protein
MSNDNLQNLNENTFKPDYGSDKHDIAYSCGHINPLQRALKNNTLPKLENIKSNLESFKNSIEAIIEDVEYIKTEVLDFAKNRCEAIRSINSELRDTIENGCECNSDCDNCYDLRSDKEDLREERDDLVDSKSELSDEVEALQNKLNSLENEKEVIATSFKEVKEKYLYLKLIFDKIINKEEE